jgi:hypothetical protein
MSQRLAWSHGFAQVGAERPHASRRTRVLESRSPTTTRLATPSSFSVRLLTFLLVSVNNSTQVMQITFTTFMYSKCLTCTNAMYLFLCQALHCPRCDTYPAIPHSGMVCIISCLVRQAPVPEVGARACSARPCTRSYPRWCDRDVRRLERRRDRVTRAAECTCHCVKQRVSRAPYTRCTRTSEGVEGT